MNTDLESLRDHFRNSLLEDTIPFWIHHAIDFKHGGYMFAVDRTGQLVDTDKSVWFQGRFAWILDTMYANVEHNSDWIEYAESGIRFLLEHGFDSDGKMYFQLARDGTPLRKRRYFFSEVFTIMAFAAYSAATHDISLASRTRRLFDKVLAYSSGEILLPAKYTEHRRTRSLASPMILIGTSQILRSTIDYPGIDSIIDRFISEIEQYFLKPREAVLMESVGPKGEILDHFEGRLLNPGHAIEAAWFILHEAKHRNNDPRLIRLGTCILDWMWERGWDESFGGLFYYRDLYGKPIQEYWHDMKFWWPHCEAIIATLLAWTLTGKASYFRQFTTILEWTEEHFPDPEFGEWFGYLHRDGSVSSTLKGGLWKGAFHVPRMQLYCWQLLEDTLKQGAKKDI